MNCSTCGQPMKKLGNISGLIYTSYPAQWDEVYVCEMDKLKKTVRVHDPFPPDYGYVDKLVEDVR